MFDHLKSAKALRPFCFHNLTCAFISFLLVGFGMKQDMKPKLWFRALEHVPTLHTSRYLFLGLSIFCLEDHLFYMRPDLLKGSNQL